MVESFEGGNYLSLKRNSNFSKISLKFGIKRFTGSLILQSKTR